MMALVWPWSAHRHVGSGGGDDFQARVGRTRGAERCMQSEEWGGRRDSWRKPMSLPCDRERAQHCFGLGRLLLENHSLFGLSMAGSIWWRFRSRQKCVRFRPAGPGKRPGSRRFCPFKPGSQRKSERGGAHRLVQGEHGHLQGSRYQNRGPAPAHRHGEGEERGVEESPRMKHH